MHWDAVVISSIVTIVICVVLLGGIACWVIKKINRKGHD